MMIACLWLCVLSTRALDAQSEPAVLPPSPPTPLIAPAAPQSATPPGSLEGRGPNVRVEVTIRDQRVDGPALTKTVSVVVASGEQGRVRTLPHGLNIPTPLNVDASPEVSDNNRIFLRLTLEYGALDGKAKEQIAAGLPRGR
jgi:hypothetical protein